MNAPIVVRERKWIYGAASLQLSSTACPSTHAGGPPEDDVEVPTELDVDADATDELPEPAPEEDTPPAEDVLALDEEADAADVLPDPGAEDEVREAEDAALALLLERTCDVEPPPNEDDTFDVDMAADDDDVPTPEEPPLLELLLPSDRASNSVQPDAVTRAKLSTTRWTLKRRTLSPYRTNPR